MLCTARILCGLMRPDIAELVFTASGIVSGRVLALNPQIYEAVEMDGFAGQMKDVIDYRTMDYYRKRYEGKTE